VCAAYLAKGGKKTLVVERRYVLGGATVTEEIFPGFKYTVLSYVVAMLRPEIIKDLDLTRRGLVILPMKGSFSPLPNGDRLFVDGTEDDVRREMSRFSKKDAEVFPHFQNLMIRLGKFAKRFLEIVPPDPTSFRPSGLRKFLNLGKHFQALDDDAFSFVRLMTMSVSDWLDLFFESDVIKAQIGINGIIGTYLGVRSPGTAYVLLHHYMGAEGSGAWGVPRGGMGGMIDAMASAARDFGAEIRTEAPVEKILTKNGKAIGVVLKGGEEIRAKTVVSSVDPKLTFMKMLGPDDTPPEFMDHLRKFKLRGSSGKVNLALDKLPTFPSLPDPEKVAFSDILVAPSMDYMERAFDDAKYGNFSREPFVETIFPSVYDPTMAPKGKHVASMFVQYAPYKLREGLVWDEKQREAFGDAVVNAVAKYSPDLKDLILHRQVISPWDMEQEFGLGEGNIFQGELTPDQLFFLRPVPGWAQFRMPVKNLYMCGSAVHPGGGVMGAPGRLAALEMLKDFGNGSS
jgi:phytoene dehydrogenase-like protein